MRSHVLVATRLSTHAAANVVVAAGARFVVRVVGVVGVVRVAAVAAVVGVVAVVAAGCPPNDVKPGGGKGCVDSDPTSCPNGSVCQDGACVAKCVGDNDCVQGLCEVDSGACVECLTGNDCNPGFVCNEFSNNCVEPIEGCAGDDDCGGLRCDTIKGGCVECLSDGDCGGGGLCDQLTSTCNQTQECVTDGDCSGDAAVCSPASHVCVECFNPAHCASGVCDTTTSLCVAGCSDSDPTEPNSGQGALAIAAGGAHEGSICPGDVDEFTVVVPAGATLAATLTIGGGARLILVLLDPGGLTIQTASPVNNDSIALTEADLPADTYRLRVFGADDNVSGDYLISVEVRDNAACEQLDIEPNDALGQASAIGTIAADDSLHAGAICGDDTDLFAFTADEGDDVTAAVVPGDGAGVLALSIVDAGGSALSTGNPVSLAGVAGGTLFLRVTAAGGDVTYSVHVLATNAPPVCTQTDAEPNDADNQGLALTPGAAAVGGTICAGDVDKWNFAAASLDDAVVTVAGSNVTATLIRAADGVVIAATSGQDGGTISAANLDAGGYRVVVAGENGATQTSYTIAAALSPEPVPDPCVEGGVEPDSLQAGRPLALDGTPLAGRICLGDTDFFRIDLPFTSIVTAHARFTHANGDLDIRLVDGAGTAIDLRDGVTNDEVIAQSLTAGTYFVEVFGFNGAKNTYTMETTLTGCTPEDGFEDNNSFTRPTPIGGISTVSAARCPGDDDFFALRVEGGDVLDITLTPAAAGVTMSLVSPTNGAILQADGAGAGAARTIHAEQLPAGKYVVRVTGSSADRIAYTLAPAVTPFQGHCVDDGATPNETAAAAPVLDAIGLNDGSYDIGALVMCQPRADGSRDEDWFKIALPAQKQVTVQLGFPGAADLDVELLEPKGTAGLTRSLARSFATAGQDHVTGVLNVAGTYFVKTLAFSDGQTGYSAGLTVGDPAATSCINDRFDTFKATTGSGVDRAITNDDVLDPDIPDLAATAEAFANLRVCPSDKDFFAFGSVAAGKHVIVDVTYTHSLGRDIDVILHGPGSSTTAASATVVTGTEHIDFTVATAGDYFVEVFGFQSGENAYSLTTNVQ